MNAVRAPAVAGSFYPRDAEGLLAEVRDCLDGAEADLAPGFPKMVIAPHAGVAYSGPVAAAAYALLRPARGIVTRVVILCPCHRVPVRGLALPAASAFDTPLGRVPVDARAAQDLADLAQVVVMPQAHEQEHAIEVHLPFLQHVLGTFAIVPLVVGAAAPGQVLEVLERLWGGEETLILISSDLSHYLPYESARSVDGATAAAIMALDTRITHEQACGATPIAGALLAARAHGLAPRLLDMRNSGDTAGGKSRVVGYGSFAFSSAGASYEDSHGRQLLALAREAIAQALGLQPASAPPRDAWLREQRATFVTLKSAGRLRGCIGMLEATRPLGEDVRANARAAALQDPRFAALGLAELDEIDIEVSVLSAPARIAFEDHADLLRQIVPGRDGLILECDTPAGRRRGTLLPQVWEDIPDPEQFVAQLKLKAGIPADTRSSRCAFRRYRVLKWRESELPSA
jgi:AmmeMemoRadiSam system protein B/AmmeMemoRadiSam system protein A